jgi:hypothetical protein
MELKTMSIVEGKLSSLGLEIASLKQVIVGYYTDLSKADTPEE